MVFDALGFVVSRQGQDEPHDGLEVALQQFLGGDAVHADALVRHELQHALQILAHALQRLGAVLDAGNFFPS